MNKEKINSIIESVGVPRLIIFGFAIVLCIAAGVLGLDLKEMLTNILNRVGMNGILVLAMVPAIHCGIGLNFGVSLGIIGGILGGLIAMELNLTGFAAYFLACFIGIILSIGAGALYGLLLNKVKGSEMTVSTYVGFSIISLMNIGWLLLPFKNGAIRWPIGTGLRNTIGLEDSFALVLNDFLAFTVMGIKVPTGSLLFFAIFCVIVWLFLNSKVGIAMSAVGNNPKFAAATGISQDKMRILGTVISTALAAVGILSYSQSYGFIQLYNAPLMMSFAAVAAILIGGASIKRASISNVIVGVVLFQTIISMGLPVANQILPEGNLSEILRLIISNGIILYALTKAKGGR